MSRFYTPSDLSPNQSFALPDDVYHHWCKVLRARVGDHAVLFNGQGGEYDATLTHIDKKSASVHLAAHRSDNRTPDFFSTIGLVMSRGERMDYAIQKATELGVRRIALLTSERGQVQLKYARDQKKLTHWQGVAIAACEQCGMNLIPEIIPPVPLSQWITDMTADLKLVMSLNHNPIELPSQTPAHIALLVGAEGGLSHEETDLALAHGFIAWTLGARILRTETAPVAALSVLNFLYN